MNEEIRKAMSNKKLIIGRDRVLKALRAKELTKIVLSKNCEERLQETIEKFASLASIEVVIVDMSNKELGIVCKKPFFVSTLGLK